MASSWSTAWITGASTGIGRELAIKLAAKGVAVAASARSAPKLDELAASRSNILAVPLDVTSLEHTKQALEVIEARIGPVDLAVLNAGVWDPMPVAGYDAARALSSMAVNYGGIANMLEVLLPGMIARRRGHIAIVASVAGYRGLPKAAAYAPSKAAAISLAEVLRLELAAHDITVSLINPGFVETPMTAVNDFPMPFLIKADDAAERILRGLQKRRFEIAFPWQMVATLKVLRMMPYAAYFRVVKATVRH